MSPARLASSPAGFALLLALVLGAWRPSEVDWPATWDRLARLEALDANAVEAGPLADELARVGRENAAEPRGMLLLARLERRAGREATPWVRELEFVPAGLFVGREPWLLAEILPPGRRRVLALLRGLETTPELSRDELLFSWNTGVDEARALRLVDGARPIQEALQARYPEAWSAIDLALTCRLLGDRETADRVLEETIRREEKAGRPSDELWSRRGIVALGFGDEPRARDYLGQALARGSENAALVLGGLDLAAGRLEAARSGFRPSILSDPPAAWALRGWGLTLLPAPHAVRAELHEIPRDDR